MGGKGEMEGELMAERDGERTVEQARNRPTEGDSGVRRWRAIYYRNQEDKYRGR